VSGGCGKPSQAKGPAHQSLSRNISRTPLHHLHSQLHSSALSTERAPGTRESRVACVGWSCCPACAGSSRALCHGAAAARRARCQQAQGRDVSAWSARGPDLDAVRAAQLGDGADGLVEAVLREEAQLPAPVHLQQAPQVAGLRGAKRASGCRRQPSARLGILCGPLASGG